MEEKNMEYHGMDGFVGRTVIVTIAVMVLMIFAKSLLPQHLYVCHKTMACDSFKVENTHRNIDRY